MAAGAGADAALRESNTVDIPSDASSARDTSAGRGLQRDRGERKSKETGPDGGKFIYSKCWGVVVALPFFGESSHALCPASLPAIPPAPAWSLCLREPCRPHTGLFSLICEI
jgi:hypothetical protein